MKRWCTVVAVVVALAAAPATAQAGAAVRTQDPSRPQVPVQPVQPGESSRVEPPGRPDDPPRTLRPPEEPSTVLESESAPTSLDRSLEVGTQQAPVTNRVVGSVVAAGGEAVVRGSALTAVASLSDRTASRAAGADRYATAVRLSAQHFPAGTSTVWVATGQTFPDGLAASAVAGGRGGPVLLTPPTSLPAGVRAELVRLAPREIWVVGGPGAVSDGVLQAIRQAVPGATVSRVAGADRFGTAAALAQTFFPSARSAFVATGMDFPDALGAGPAAASEDAPALLVTATSVPATTEQQLRRLRPAVVYVVGGPGPVSDAVVSRLRTITGGQVVRVAGADRYATAAAVADRFFQPTTPSVLLATGLTFPDGLGAGAVAGSLDSPLLLVSGASLPPRATSDAARRVSWWLPDSGRVLRYTVITHPDDEFAAWSVVGERDPRRYDVFVLLTTGESTGNCNGRAVSNPWMSQQYLPQPQPTGVQYSERCKKHRLDSWNVFLDRAGAGSVGPYQRLERGPITFDGRQIPVPRTRDEAGNVLQAGYLDLAVGPNSARVSFDMGALTTDEILWAIQTARGLGGSFPTQVEGDAIGAGFYNDSGTGYPNLHEDHRAVYQLLGSVDLGLPGSQYTTVGHAQRGRAFGATVGNYCAFMCHPGAPSPYTGSMGHFQYAYGWLNGGYWPPGEVDVYAGFSRYQSFAKWF